MIEFEVSGDASEAVYLLPGYVHNVINLSQTEKAGSMVWVNEVFNAERADTYAEKVGRG